MSGPAPKHPSERRRRNRPPELRQLPGDGSGLEAPAFPNEQELSEFGRNYWRDLWASPMAVVWEPIDIPALVRLVRMQDRQMLGTGTATELREIATLEDRFGLTPGARQRLRWEVAKPAAGEGTRAARPAGSSSPAKRRLRAV